MSRPAQWKAFPLWSFGKHSLRLMHGIAARLMSPFLRPVQWADVRVAVTLSAVILAACAALALPSFWPHGLDGACTGALGFGWNGADVASLRGWSVHDAKAPQRAAAAHDATHASDCNAGSLSSSCAMMAPPRLEMSLAAARDLFARATVGGTSGDNVMMTPQMLLAEDIFARIRLPDAKPHLALAMLGMGILVAISAVRGATSPGTLHVRAFKVQAVVLAEVVASHALIATGFSAPICRTSTFLSGDAAVPFANVGGCQSAGYGACISCAQRYLLRYASWWAGQVAFLSLVAHVLRMRRAFVATVLASITFNVLSGVAMAFHALRGMGWIFAHAALVIYVTGLYVAHSWFAWRASCRCTSSRAGGPVCRQLRTLTAGHHRRISGLERSPSPHSSDSSGISPSSAGSDSSESDSDHAAAAVASGDSDGNSTNTATAFDAAGTDADSCMQKVAPRLAAFAGACAVFILAVRFAAGAVQMRVPCDWKPLFEACEDAVMYLLAPLALISGEVLADARLLTARLAAAEARAKAKRDVLRFFSHEVRGRCCSCCLFSHRVLPMLHSARGCGVVTISPRLSHAPSVCCEFRVQLRVPLNGIVVGLELLAGLDRSSDTAAMGVPLALAAAAAAGKQRDIPQPASGSGRAGSGERDSLSDSDSDSSSANLSGRASPAPGTGGSATRTTNSSAAASGPSAAAAEVQEKAQGPPGGRGAVVQENAPGGPPGGHRAAVVQEMQGAAEAIKSLVSDFLTLESARVSSYCCRSCADCHAGLLSAFCSAMLTQHS